MCTLLVGTSDFSLNAESPRLLRDPTLNLRSLPAPGPASWTKGRRKGARRGERSREAVLHTWKRTRGGGSGGEGAQGRVQPGASPSAI